VTVSFALYFRSPEEENPSIDTPRYTACWTLCSAHCVINSLILGWAGNGEKHNVMRERNNYKIDHIMSCFLPHYIGYFAGLVCLFLHTPWYRFSLEKLTCLQLVKKFHPFHGTRRFIIALTSVRHLSLSSTSPIQST